MAHERQAIRDAIVAQLKGPVPYVRTSAQDRVYKTRSGPPREGELPVICLFVAEEEIDENFAASAPRELLRTATLNIEGWVKVSPGNDLDAAMDDLALQIEAAMDLDIFLAGTVFSSVLGRTRLGTAIVGNQPMACCSLEYLCTYHTMIRMPNPTDHFTTADIRTSLLGVQAPAEQSHDVVKLP